jgi:APA family basic amino acid/polyamine antiporter
MQKKITLMQCISLVTGNLVGSGVFMLPVLLAVYGSSSIIGWVITSISAVCLALVFAKLSIKVPKCHGGPQSFIMKSFGKSAGFWAAWGYWVLTWSSNTALIVAATSYLSKIFQGFSTLQTLIVQISIWGAITTINIVGVRTAAKFELIVTVLKLVPIVLIPFIGLFFINFDNLLDFMPSDNNISIYSSIKACVFLTLWAFIGVESATVPAKNVENPSKTIAIATILGTSVAALVYILGSVAIIGVLGNDKILLSTAPYADLANVLFGGSWGMVIAVFSVISCIGAFNGWSLVVARIAQGAADEGIFPKIFSKENSAGTPVASILISSFCTLIAIFFTLQKDMLVQFNLIIDTAVTLILLIYLASILSFFRIIKQKSFVDYIVSCISLLFVLFAIYSTGVITLLHAVILLLTGLPVFLVCIKKLNLGQIFYRLES